jgi:hypothetical protein
MKRLLVTSDDFGMAHAVNLGITRALAEGFVASTNFLAPAPWFREAVEIAKAQKLDVGVHLCLGADWDRLTWAPVSGNPRLMSEPGRMAVRPEHLEALGATDEDIYEELKAQILLVRRLYGEPTHLDSHMIGGRVQAGILERIQKVIAALAAEFRLAYTYERDRDGKLRHFVAEDCMTLMPLEELFRRLEAWKEPGNYHLFGHAAVESPELSSMCSPGHPARAWAAESRVEDLRRFTDLGLLARIESQGFQLVTRQDARAFLASLA